MEKMKLHGVAKLGSPGFGIELAVPNRRYVSRARATYHNLKKE
jgi:hypothetical protein